MYSYRRNVARGVTGMKTGTCYPASLDKISPYNQLSPETYVAYQEFTDVYDDFQGQEKRKINPLFKKLISQIAWELGEVEFDDIFFERTNSYREFSNTVRWLLRHEFRVSVDIHMEDYGERIVHPVGLVPVDNDGGLRVVSTWIPSSLYGVVTLREVYETLDFNSDLPRIRYPFNDSNITALPPAA